MRKILQQHLLIALGWFFVLLGIIGILLPLIPGTPFLILALALFSKNSPRFHQMLLHNRWIGPGLRQWEEEKTISRKTKYKVTLLIVTGFSISITILHERMDLQWMLVFIAMLLLLIIWRIKEPTRD